MTVENRDPVQRPLVLDICSDLRPYIRCIVVDFIVSVLTWVLFWAALQVKAFLKGPPLADWAVSVVHAIATITIVSLLAGLLIRDFYEIRTGRRR